MEEGTSEAEQRKEKLSVLLWMNVLHKCYAVLICDCWDVGAYILRMEVSYETRSEYQKEIEEPYMGNVEKERKVANNSKPNSGNKGMKIVMVTIHEKHEVRLFLFFLLCHPLFLIFKWELKDLKSGKHEVLSVHGHVFSSEVSFSSLL